MCHVPSAAIVPVAAAVTYMNRPRVFGQRNSLAQIYTNTTTSEIITIYL